MSPVTFVGRVRELAALSRWLRSATQGEGGLVLVEEPGIGKTTLAAELTRSAWAAGILAGWEPARARMKRPRSSPGSRS